MQPPTRRNSIGFGWCFPEVSYFVRGATEIGIEASVSGLDVSMGTLPVWPIFTQMPSNFVRAPGFGVKVKNLVATIEVSAGSSPVRDVS